MTLTEEQFKEKYGEVEVVFSSYFKYTFSFTGNCEEGEVRVMVGGSSDAIYRFNVTADEEVKVRDLDFSYATVNKSGKLIDECNNWW